MLHWLFYLACRVVEYLAAALQHSSRADEPWVQCCCQDSPEHRRNSEHPTVIKIYRSVIYILVALGAATGPRCDAAQRWQVVAVCTAAGSRMWHMHRSLGYEKYVTLDVTVADCISVLLICRATAAGRHVVTTSGSEGAPSGHRPLLRQRPTRAAACCPSWSGKLDTWWRAFSSEASRRLDH